MNRLKKLILSMLLLCSTSTFAAGFDKPREAFDFYYKLAVKAAEYKERTNRYSKKHINALAPHVWSKRNPPHRAKVLLAHHYGYLLRAEKYRGEYPMKVNPRFKGPIKSRRFKQDGVLEIWYSYYDFQPKVYSSTLIKLKAKKIGNKIKWFII